MSPLLRNAERFGRPGPSTGSYRWRMFEHMRNYERPLGRIASWLRPGGALFVHLFCHRRYCYFFEDDGRNDWMARNSFTGGMMPSVDRPFIGDILAQHPCLCVPRFADGVRPRGCPGSIIKVQRLRFDPGRAVCRQVVILQPPITPGLPSATPVSAAASARSLEGSCSAGACASATADRPRSRTACT